MTDPKPPGDKAGSWRGVTVAIVGMVLLATLGILAVFAFAGGKPAVATDVIAVLGLVVGPIVSLASAYYGITVSSDTAKRAQEENQELIELHRELIRKLG